MDIIRGYHEWEELVDGLPPEAVALGRLAGRIADSIIHIRAMLAKKTELKNVEENLFVMKLGMDIEVLAQSLIAIVREHTERAYIPYIRELQEDLRSQIKEIKEAQKSGSFAATAQGTADYVIKVASILNMIYYALFISKRRWLLKQNIQNLPRTQIQQEVNRAVETYLEHLLPIARGLVHLLSYNGPKPDPEEMLDEFMYYLFIAPTKYIPSRAYHMVLDKMLSRDKKYTPVISLIQAYMGGSYNPYAVEIPSDTYEQMVLSRYSEEALAEVMLYEAESYSVRLANIPLDEIFAPLVKYTLREIEDAITTLIDERAIKEFWQIFTKEILLRAGIHVEVEEEEEKKEHKRPAKRPVAAAPEEKVFETPVELSPEAEAEVMKILEEEGV